MKPMGHFLKMCSGISETATPLSCRGKEDAVRQRDEEGAGSTEAPGLERPEAGLAESGGHVTGGRDGVGGGRACL